MPPKKPIARPGRPRKALFPQEAKPTAAVVVNPTEPVPQPAQEASEPTKRRRRASVGMAATRLAAPTRDGFKRRWFNDVNNRIADAGELGYDHVTEHGIQSSDPSTRISRLVGTKANGEPLRAFLMETPDELYAEGVAEKERHNRLIDDAIRAGRDSTGHLEVSDETYGHGSIKNSVR